MVKKMPHSKFKLTNTNLMTTGFGRLTPFYFQRTVPGDRLRLGSAMQVQLMPLLAPAFQDCRMYVHYYYVPERILHNNDAYNAFISREQRNLFQNPAPFTRSYTMVKDVLAVLNRLYRNNSSGSVVPWKVDSTAVLNLLPDYLRVQLGAYSDYSQCSEMVVIDPFVAYFKIFLDHYVSTQYGTYFIDSTSVNGDNSYKLISYNDLLYFFSWCKEMTFDHYISAASTCFLPELNANIYALDLLMQIAHTMYGRKGDMFMEMYPSAETQPAEAIGTDIASIRLAETLQEFRERKARVGHGVAEFLWEFFHVKNRDTRLQLSEFLGGGRSTINIDDVIQTSQTSSGDSAQTRTDASALGELGGNAWKKSSFGFGRRYFDEYGYVFGLVYFLPKQAYFQGVDQIYHDYTADDLYLEAFDSIGDEPVFQRELMLDTNANNNDNIIGYQPRYQRYKRVKNEIHGDFCTSLAYFHQSRHLPVNVTGQSLRQAFAKPQSLNRIFNYNGISSEAGDQPIMMYIKNTARWRRKMRYKPIPHL